MIKITIEDQFWEPKLRKMCQEIIPYQYEVLNDNIPGIPSSHAIENFRIASGKAVGKYSGMLFQDSDVGKWIEAAAYSLQVYPSSDLQEKIDSIINLIELAQQPDGYLNTYYSGERAINRFTNISHGHELYCAGHLLEAAIAYYQATGKDKFLQIMIKYINYLIDVIGPNKGQLHIYSGHPEIELAVYKLYQVTQNKKYLSFVKYLIDERGTQPSFLLSDPYFGEKFKDKWYALPYHQAHKPVREQYEAVGHAVRALYLYSGMTDLANEMHDESLYSALDHLWEDVTTRKMYITGAVGAEAHGESFGIPYDLPNDRAYAETCASIALVFWAHRMLKHRLDSRYTDIMELALYNSVLSGMGKDGETYFYVNPLEVDPDTIEARFDLQHVEPQRVKWFGCACCPPNIARTIASIDRYLYDFNDTERKLVIHLYVSGRIEFNSNRYFSISETYLKDGKVRILYSGMGERLSLYCRIPGWSQKYVVYLCGEIITANCIGGYIHIQRDWRNGDEVVLQFNIQPQIVYPHPKIKHDSGKVALMRGPIVYCFEEADNGPFLNQLVIDPHQKIDIYQDDSVSGVCPCIMLQGLRETEKEWGQKLYSFTPPRVESRQIKAIPYFEWGNRGKGEMIVWIRQTDC